MGTAQFVKRGAPFMILIIGAPFVLQQFNGIRYKYKSTGMLTSEQQLRVEEVEQARKAGVALDPQVNDMLEKIRKDQGQEWNNIRGPRPWEDSREVQMQQRSKDN